MPFIQLLVNQKQVDSSALIAVRDAVRTAVASALTLFDPDHMVAVEMVDVTVSFVGPLDLVTPPMYVTVLARDEPARTANRDAIVTRIEAAVLAAGAPLDSMVELVLSNRASAFVYETEM